MYELEYDENASNFLEKLPYKIRERIANKLRDSKENPFHYFIRLAGRNDYKLRVGDYRVIADIEANKIYIRFIGHRKNIYKNFSFFFDWFY